MTTPLDTYLREFSHADYAIEPVMLAFLAGLGFADHSWHNEPCPSFDIAEKQIVVYIDCLQRDKREHTECDRFSIHRTDDEGTMLDEVAPETFEEFGPFAARLREIIGA